MKHFSIIILIAIITNSIFAQNDSLLFKSSFNNDVIRNIDDIWNPHLSGTDMETGYTFPDDLPGNNSENYFNYVIGDYNNYQEFVNTEIVTTLGINGDSTNALYIEFIQDDTSFVSYSRVQYVINGDETSNDPVQRMNKGYIKYKVKKHYDKNNLDTDWNLPLEWKDIDDDGFRMGLYIYDPNGDSPYWVAKGQYMIDGGLGDDIWEYQNYDIAVPEDEWYELEAYWLADSDPSIGKFVITLNGEILFDITNQTKDENQPTKMFYFMPFKIYGNVGHAWITDFEYWSGPPNNIVSLDKDKNTQEWKTYPNPVNDIFNIKFPNTQSGILTVTNILGKVIFSQSISNQKNIAVDFSKYKSGNYTLNFITDKNTTFTKIIMKK